MTFTAFTTLCYSSFHPNPETQLRYGLVLRGILCCLWSKLETRLRVFCDVTNPCTTKSRVWQLSIRAPQARLASAARRSCRPVQVKLGFDSPAARRDYRNASVHAIWSVSSVCLCHLQFRRTRRWFTGRFLKKQKKLHDGVRTKSVCLRTSAKSRMSYVAWYCDVAKTSQNTRKRSPMLHGRSLTGRKPQTNK